MSPFKLTIILPGYAAFLSMKYAVLLECADLVLKVAEYLSASLLILSGYYIK